MPLRKLFWFLSVLTIVFLALQALGYDVLEVVASLLLIDVVVIEISREEDADKFKIDLKQELAGKIENVERVCKNLLSSLELLPTVEHMYHIADERIENHKTQFKTELKDDLDKIAAKVIEIENRMNGFKKTFAAGFSVLDDRLKSMEAPVYIDDEEVME